MSVSAVMYVAVSLMAIIGGIAAFVRWAHPHFKARRIRERAKDFAILGGPIIDPLTGKTTGVQPPIGQWMSDINGGLSKLTATVSSLNDAHRRLEVVEANQAALQRDVAELKKARTERMVTQAESAQMWRALADKDPELLRPGFDEDDD